MDYRYLRAFLVLGEQRSFTRAAKKLGIAVSALSRQIRLLEESVSESLFIRSSRSVRLTSSGERLLKSARQFAGAVDRDFAGDAAKPLMIGSLQSVLESFLCRVMANHREIFSGLSELRVGSPEELEQSLLTGELDLALSTAVPESPLLASYPIYREKLFVVTSKSAPVDGSWIIYSTVAKSYPREARDGKNTIRVNSFNAALALVRSGIGKTILPMSPAYTSGGTGDLRVEPFRTSEPDEVYAIIPALTILPDRIRKILGTLRACR